MLRDGIGLELALQSESGGIGHEALSLDPIVHIHPLIAHDAPGGSQRDVYADGAGRPRARKNNEKDRQRRQTHTAGGHRAGRDQRFHRNRECGRVENARRTENHVLGVGVTDRRIGERDGEEDRHELIVTRKSSREPIRSSSRYNTS